LVYAHGLDSDLLNWRSWQRGIGGYGNRFSHVDLLSQLVAGQDCPEHFVILEDDIDLRSPAYVARVLRRLRRAMGILSADVAIMSGWDYMPKQVLPGQGFRFNPTSRCVCALGKQFNLYTLNGAKRFLGAADRHPGLHLDEAIARLQLAGDLLCIGLRRNPFSCFESRSDVAYADSSGDS